MKKVDLTKGNVLSVLTALAIPIVGSSLLQFTYNLVDMIWVGGLGSDAVASIGSASFFTGLGYALNSLVVIGGGIKVAHALGRNKEEEVKSYINNATFVNFIIAFLFALMLIVFGKNLIGFLELGNESVEIQSINYLLVSAPSMFFSFFNMMYIRILGCYGLNSDALKISTVGIVINIILDPILIYVAGLGVSGAAAATLVSNIVMFILFNIKSKGLFKFSFSVGIDKHKILEIVRLGIPMTMQRVLFTIVNIILAKIIAVFGADAIAGQKIGLQVESITFMIIGGLNGSIASFTGQNYGAKEYKRIIQGYNAAIKLSVIYAIITSTLFIAIPEQLAMIFVRETATIEITAMYLRIIALSQIFSAVEMVSNGMFTGVGQPKIPSNISMIFTVLRIPMALIFIKYFGVNGVWLSISVSSILKGIASYSMYRIKIKGDEKYA